MNTVEYGIIEGFIVDESFENFVKRSNEADQKKWEKWLEEHPDKIEIFQKAVEVVSDDLKKKRSGATIL